MEIFIIVFVCIILLLTLLGIRTSIMERFDRLEQEIRRLRDVPPAPTEPKQPEPAQHPAAAPMPTAAPAAAPAPTPQPEPHFQPHFERMPEPGFFERHPDLEKFIGENLMSKIGIAILVLAIGFFVKYAIDNNWIGPVGRVGVGIACGGILIGIAHWLRKQYKGFSSVLVGGGLAVLYCTIALAYHQYQLLGQTAAFIVMLVITAFSVLLSLLYDREELAIIALVGGFITPFLVSSGKASYEVLFTYLLILNGGLLVIAYNKAWRLLNILAFGFTVVLYASWLISLPYDAPAATYSGGWIFATIFYFLFFVINIVYTILARKPLVASDFILLLLNTCLYFAAGLYLIAQLGLDRYKGLFSAGMGVFNLGATWFLFRRSKVDKNILYLLVGITLSFVSLTAPLQLHGHYITLFWASEAVLLYWLFVKSQIRLIRLSSLIIWGAMLVSLFIDWVDVYAAGSFYDIPNARLHVEALPILFNKGLMTGIYVAICCGALFFLQRGTARAKASLAAAVIVLYVSGALEINYQITYRLPAIDLTLIYLSVYTYLFVWLISLLSDRAPLFQPYRLIAAALLTAGVLLYLVSLPEIFEVQKNMLQTEHYPGHFTAHWIGVLFVVLILARLLAAERTGKIKIAPAVFTWLISLITVTLLSAEGQLLVNTLCYSHTHGLEELARVYNKTGLPILWGLCSFAFMWLGMRHKFKPLRILSLVLFSVTLVKLFLFDIRNIPIAGKIAAFFCLGVLLLVVSFMYQRLKKIIVCVGIAFALPHSRAVAQGTFAYAANVDTVSRDGFYEIVLTPEIVAKSRADMGDLRVLSPDKSFVSYALKDSQEARMPTAAMAVHEVQMVQKDSNDRHSYLTLTFPEAYSIDWVGFSVRNPAFFKRSLQILAEGPHPDEWATVSDADLDPERKLFRISTIKTRRLRIVVANADNAPLEVGSVTCYQTNRYLVAWLQAGETYRLYTGNAQATTPDYDLKYFADSLKAAPQMISVHPLQRIGSQDQPAATMPAAPARETIPAVKTHSGILLWSCLMAVLLFLVYFSVRMAKAIAKKDAHDRI